MSEITNEAERAIQIAELRLLILQMRRDADLVIADLQSLLAHIEAGGQF